MKVQRTRKYSRHVIPRLITMKNDFITLNYGFMQCASEELRDKHLVQLIYLEERRVIALYFTNETTLAGMHRLLFNRNIKISCIHFKRENNITEKKVHYIAEKISLPAYGMVWAIPLDYPYLPKSRDKILILPDNFFEKGNI